MKGVAASSDPYGHHDVAVLVVVGAFRANVMPAASALLFRLRHLGHFALWAAVWGNGRERRTNLVLALTLGLV